MNKMMATLLTEDAEYRTDMAVSQVKIEDRTWYGEPYGVRLTAPLGCPVTFDQLRELAEAHLGRRVDHVHSVVRHVAWDGTVYESVDHDQIEEIGNVEWRPFDPAHCTAEAVCFDVEHPTSGEVPEWRQTEIREAVDAAIAAARGTSDRRVALLINDEWEWLEDLPNVEAERILQSRWPEVVRENSVVAYWCGDWRVSTGKMAGSILWDDCEGHFLAGKDMPRPEYIVALDYAMEVCAAECERLPEAEWDRMRATATAKIKAQEAREAAERRERSREARRAFYARVKAGDVTIADISRKTGWCIAGIAHWMGLPAIGDIKIEVQHLLRLAATQGDYHQRLEVVID